MKDGYLLDAVTHMLLDVVKEDLLAREPAAGSTLDLFELVDEAETAHVAQVGQPALPPCKRVLLPSRLLVVSQMVLSEVTPR